MADNISANEKQEEILLKIFLLGRSSAGKTEFLLRYYNEISDQISSMVGIEIMTKYIKRDNKLIQLGIWDTAGQERFRSLLNNFVRGVDGILFLYDITNKETFLFIQKQIDNIEKTIDINKKGLLVVANNCDKDKKEWEVTEEMEKKLTEKHNIKIMKASAKNNINVNESFDCLVDMMLNLGLGNKEKSKSIIFENYKNKGKVNSGCYNKSK